MKLKLALTLTLTLLPSIAFAQTERQWWECQKQQDQPHQSCCGDGNGRVLRWGQWRPTSDPQFPFEVLLEDAKGWTKVPRNAWITDQCAHLDPHPADAKVWFQRLNYQWGTVYDILCFITGTMG
jgi:hypothetical protein